MRKGFQLLLFGFIFLAFAGVNHIDNCVNVANAATVNKCKCGRKKCRGCSAKRRTCRKCPKCQNDVCVLKAECVKDERVCFEVEQKLICIPKISLPWRKCEKPCCGDCASNCRHRCGKTRTIKVLKTKAYECDVCKYSWKVYEPEELDINSTTPPDQPAVEPQYETPEQPKYDDSELYDPAGSDVPKAPEMNKSSRALMRRIKGR